MKVLLTHWINPENIKKLSQLNNWIEELRRVQIEIERIVHLPENRPAVKLSIDEVEPLVKNILKIITAMMESEVAFNKNNQSLIILKSMAD